MVPHNPVARMGDLHVFSRGVFTVWEVESSVGFSRQGTWAQSSGGSPAFFLTLLWVMESR
jgi:hypothetical protein